ncbi:hypothetical protein QBC43DRAFT_292534 [Cladorrhinum sp. PSN259]|nr:hypothetical protein QBC43DRAFT_292534 [Cladorrhinum sp. PSN259]
MKLFSHALTVVLGLVLSLAANVAEGCSNGSWSATSTDGTYPSYAALTNDCINLANSFTEMWNHDPEKKQISYTEDNGIVHFTASGTCQFLLRVTPGSNPVVINYSIIAELISKAVSMYHKVLDGEDRVGAVGTYDCREDGHAEAGWWLEYYPF